MSSSSPENSAATHVAMVIDCLRLGGAERLTVDILNHLPANETTATLVLLHEHLEAASLLEKLDARIDVVRLGAPARTSVALGWQLARLFRRLRPDVVQTHLFRSNLLGGFAAHAARVPVHLWTEHYIVPATNVGSREVENHPLKHNAPRRALAALGSHFVGVSELVEDTLRNVVRLPAAHVHHVYNGINLDQFATAKISPALRSSCNIPPDAVVIGACGRLTDGKGVDRFAAAARAVMDEIADVHTLVVGDGPLRSMLEEQLAAYRDRLHITGPCSNVAPYVAMMDLFVAASNIDTLGIVLYEALALGRACVVVRSGGARSRWFADAPVRFVEPSEDIQPLVVAIRELVQAADARRRYASLARSFAESKCDIRRSATEYLALYRTLLRKTRN